MKSNTCLLWGCETFELCPNDLVINKKTPCDNLRNLRNPCSPLHPVVRKLFKVIILGSNLSKVLRGEGFVKLLDVDLIHIVLCRSVRICGNRNRMIFQASKINRDELIRLPNPWFIADGELIYWWPVHNVHFVKYDGPVVKSWNPKIHFLMGKKYFWGHFSYVVLGRKL